MPELEDAAADVEAEPVAWRLDRTVRARSRCRCDRCCGALACGSARDEARRDSAEMAVRVDERDGMA